MKTLLLYIFILISIISVKAEEKLIKGPKLIFEENKNQWPKQVLFETEFAGGKLFLEKNTFTYFFTEKINFHDNKKNENKAPKIHYHSFKVNFLNSNNKVVVKGNTPLSFHRNYFLGNDSSNWATGVKLFEEVSYENLYPFIDMNVYNLEQNLKYDLVINAGGDPSDIKFEYVGADKMHIKNGNLYIQTSLGKVVEQKPFAYQMIDGVKKEIACSYKLEKNILSFSIKNKYDTSLPLVIDPVLIASTYTGSFADNWGFTATYDNSGNIYTAGIAASSGYPTTIGAWDNTFNGGLPWTSSTYPYDIAITKYNSNGTTILFSTYYGGSKNEQPHSLFVNNNNELYLTGRTNSINFPATLGAYDATHNGGYDIIVGKFNTAGALLASTFIGGTGDDGVNINADESVFGSLKFNYADDGRGEIILDNNSNVFVVGSTRSSNFPTSTGAFDASLGGTQDGCVFKMNANLGSLVFSTYIGGSADDAAYGLKLDLNNILYITGGTASANFPTTAGVLNPTFKGGPADGFVSAISSNGSSLLYSTYIGTAAYDQSYLIETDDNNDIYIYGQTKGAYPFTPGIYSIPNSGQFIHKINKELNATIFSTVIGTGNLNPNLSPTAFLVDSCQSIYIAGWGRCSYAFGQPSPSSVTGMPVTGNAYKSTTDGCDFYFMVLRPNAQSLLYATFFGENSPIGDHVDGGTSRFDKRGFIYQSVCASCGGFDNFPTTPTAWSRNNNSNNCNNAVIKMDLQVKPSAVAVLIGSHSGCAPHTVSFNNTGSSGTNFQWDFGDGSPIATGFSQTHTYTNIGSFTASLYASDTTGTCGHIDTATINIQTGASPLLSTLQTSVFCYNGNNGTATVSASGGLSPYSYLWSNSGGQTSATASNLSAGTYNVIVTNVFGCAATTSVNVIQPSLLTVNTSFTNISCSGGSDGTATATVLGGSPPYSYLWLPGGYTTASVSGLTVNSFTVTVNDSKSCVKTAFANITEPAPLSFSAVITNAICGQSNGSALLTGSGGFAPYTWSWSGGQTSANVAGLAIGSYTVTIKDVNLCSASLPVSIANVSGPNSSITSTNVLCNGQNDGSATINLSGGALPFTYLWNNGQITPTASNLVAGIYSVIATDNLNCSATESIIITEPPPLIANAFGINPSCYGFSNGSALVSALDGTPPYSYLWATPGNPTTSSITGYGSGVYNVTVTDFNGCIKLAAVTLLNPNAISTFINNTSVLCKGDCNGTATAAASNGFPPYFYQWNDPSNQGTETAIGLCATSFSVATTDAHGCSSVAATTIASPEQLTATISSIGNISCFGLCDGFVQVTAVGGSPPYSYDWQTGLSTNATKTGLCAGVFNCTITDANGCIAILTDTIFQPNQLTSAVNVLKIPCNGMCDGAITASNSGGVPPYNYLWLPGLQNIFNPSDLCAGSNTVTITDSQGCSSGGAILLTEPPLMTASASSTNSDCGQTNGQACVIVSGGSPPYNYLWNSAITDTLDCATGLLANIYTVKVTDGMACVLYADIIVNDISDLVVTIDSSSNPSCFEFSNGSARATVSGTGAPFSFLWTPGGQTIINPTNLSAGLNTLSVTNNTGCTGSASILIVSPPAIASAITGIQKPSCFGLCDGSATLLYNGGTPPLTIAWNDPGLQTSYMAENLCAGTYLVKITDAVGCFITDSSAIISQPNELIIQNNLISNITCEGDTNGVISYTISGGMPFYTYSWTPNVSASATASNLGVGNYTLVVNDTKGCSASQSNNIVQPSILNVTSSSTPSSCNLSTGSATIITTGGTPSYLFQWNDPGLQTSAMAQNLSGGNYLCKITDVNGCIKTDTVLVGGIQGPVIDSIVATSALCYGDSTGIAKVYIKTGTGNLPFNYLWTPSLQVTNNAVGLAQGSYNILITDSNGCETNGNVLINQPPELILMSSSIDTVCYNANAQIYAQATGGTPNYIYNWIGTSGIGLSGSGPHLVTPISNIQYLVNVVDANGCLAGPIDLQIIISPPLSIIASPNLVLCDGTYITISAIASGGSIGYYDYLWSNGSTNQSQTISPSISLSPVKYIVTSTDACSQPASDTIIVTVLPNPSGIINLSDSSGCEPLKVNFNASSNNSNVNYTWDFGDAQATSGPSPSHTYANEGIYNISLIITSADGCTTILDSSNTIVVNPLPTANFSINPIPSSSANTAVNFIDLSTATIVSWLWNFGDYASAANSSIAQNPSHIFTNFGIYNVQLIVTNEFGCLDTVNKEFPTNEIVIFPNVFTPNPDQSSGGLYNPLDLSNDVFFPHNYGIIEYNLEIYSRWGELLFVSDNIKIGWDGYYKNKICQQDVYVWQVKIKFSSGKLFEKAGDVTLLRPL